MENSIKYSVCIAFLSILSICDIKKREVPRWTVLLGALVAYGWAVAECIAGNVSRSNLLWSVVPGVIFLLIARLTGKVGYGDGWILLELGLVLGYRQCMFLLCVSLVTLSLCVVVLMGVGKVNRHTRIPFLPYLDIALILNMLLIRFGG